MGFFSDFIGSFTGSNERKAARKEAEGFARGIQFTKEQIAQTRREVADLANAAFQNVQEGFNASFDIPSQVLSAQLQLLGAGTEALSPEGPTNALRRGVRQANQALVGGAVPKEQPAQFTPVGTNPLVVEKPTFTNPLLGLR